VKASYDQFVRIIESMVMHKVLLEQQEVPLFLRNPDPQTTKNYKEIMGEFGSTGFLSFNIILHRLKNKKYGPGKANLKHDNLLADMRKVFQVCEFYYNYDPVSIRVNRTLESYFENEIKKLERGEGGKVEPGPSKPLEKKQSKGVRQNFNSEGQSERDRYENSSFSYKRIKKDKKKEKNKIKKNKRDRRNDRDSDDNKDGGSIGNVNEFDLNEEIEKGDAYGSNSGNLA